MSSVTSPVSASTINFTVAGSSILDGIVTTDLSRPTLVGSGPPNASLQVTIDGQLVGNTVVGADGRWSFVLSQPIAGGQHVFDVSEPGGAAPDSIVDLTRLTTDISSTSRYLLLSDPSEIGPKMAFGVGVNGTVTFAPSRPAIPGADSNWFVVQWLHGQTSDPSSVILNDTQVVDPTLGHPSYTFVTPDREEELNVFSQSGNTDFVYDLRQNGGEYVGAGSNLLMQAMVQSPLLATFDHPITFDIDAKLSEANATAAAGMSVHGLGIEVSIGFELNFNEPGSVNYDSSIPSYHVLFQIPLSQTSDEAQFLYPPSYGLHLGAGASELQNVAGEVLPGAPELALEPDGGPLHHLSFNLNRYLSALLEQSSYTDPASGQLTALPAEFFDLSRWDVEGVYIGSETTNQYPSILSGTAAVGLSFADVQMAMDPSSHVTYSPPSLDNRVPSIIAPAPGAVPTPLAGSGVAPPAPVVSRVELASSASVVNVSGLGAAGDLIVVSVGSAAMGHAVVGTDGSWSLTLAAALPAGASQLSAIAYDAYGAISALSNQIEVFENGGQLTILGDAEAATTIAAAAPGSPTLQLVRIASDPHHPEVSGTAPPGCIVELYEQAQLLGATLAGSDGAWTLAVSLSFGAGNHILAAVAIDEAGNTSPMSAPITIAIATDNSSHVISAPDASGLVNDRSYNSAGQLTKIDTLSSQGLVLRSVSSTAALMNIYASGGTLIGTVSQLSSSPDYQPTFGTSVDSGRLLASTGSAGSLVALFSSDQILDSQGNDSITLGTGADTIFASGASVSVAGGSGSLLFVSGGGANTVLGGTGSAAAFGGAGGGYLSGGSAGHNVLVAGAGNTTLVGGGSGDVLVAGAGHTTITMREDGIAFGSTGATTFYGAANSIMVGGSGDATLIARGGAESLFAGSGSCTLTGGSGNAILAGSDVGQAVMQGGNGDTTFVGFGGRVTAIGGAGNDTFFTGAGEMQITEGAGNDKVAFGAGQASVKAGTGIDHFVFLRGHVGGAVDISGFKVGTDQIELYGYDQTRVQTNASASNTALSLEDGTQIMLSGAIRLDASSIVAR